MKEKDAAGAITKYTAALELCQEGEPTHLLYSNRSAAALKLKNFAQALQDAEKCVELAPKWGKGYVRLATVLKEMDRPEEAMKVIARGIEVEPDSTVLKLMAEQLDKTAMLDNLRGSVSFFR